MRLPDFFLIGAAKSGTTALAAQLARHPGIFMPATKEPNHFALAGRTLPAKGPAPAHVLQATIYNWSVTDRAAYEALFAAAGPGQVAGEASVRYLYFPETAARIHAALPRARLVALLREPFARIHSHHVMNRQILLEPLDLAAALAAEDGRVAAGWGWDWHYLRVSLYGEQLARYAALFGQEALAVFFHEDFVRDPAGTFRAVCRHIGADEGFDPGPGIRAMVGSLPRSAALARWLWWPNPVRARLLRHAGPLARPLVARLKAWNALPPPKPDPALRAALAGRLAADRILVEEIAGRRAPWGERG